MSEREIVLITRPCYDTYEFENIVSLSHMKSETQASGPYSCINHYVKGSNISKAREQGVEVARKVKAKWILSVDSDMFIPQGSLLKLLKHDKDIITGVAVAKQEPFSFILRKKNNDGTFHDLQYLPNQRLFEVDGAGFGFILIKTEVFDKIELPYFNMRNGLGEDYYFCDKARKAGFHIWVDTTCQLGHIGSTIYTIDDHNACVRPNPKPLLIDAGGKVLVH